MATGCSISKQCKHSLDYPEDQNSSKFFKALPSLDFPDITPSSPNNTVSVPFDASNIPSSKNIVSFHPLPLFNEGERRILAVFQKILDLPPEVTDIPEDIQRELEAAKELEKRLATESKTLPTKAKSLEAEQPKDPSTEAISLDTARKNLEAARQLPDLYQKCLGILSSHQIYLLHGKTNIAKNLLNEVAAIASDPSLLLEISQIYLDQKEYEKARGVVEKAIENIEQVKSPESPKSVFKKAKTLLREIDQASKP